jgi:hypothetical protein
MSTSLKQYLFETYSLFQNFPLPTTKNNYIQIDDQDDYDNVSDFCNIFVTILRKNTFEIEFIGKIPITREIADLVDIYHGTIDLTTSRITLILNLKQIEVLLDIASLFRKTAGMGNLVGNAHWFKYCARTTGSLNRFVRGIKEYVAIKQKQLL